MKNGKVQAAILGCGNIGNNHAKAILNNSDLINLYAVCDIIPEKAELYQEKYHAERVYTNMEDLLRDPVVDMVSICTPSGYHAEHVVACAAHGKNVLCEKPLDITREKIQKMIDSFKGTKLKAGAVFQYRTYPGIQRAKEIIQSGELGKILVANAYYQQYRSPEYYRSAGWRGTWAIDGGGSTMNQGIHIMDILCYLAGGAESILAKAPTLSRAIEVEDVSCAVITFRSGAVGTYQATTLSNPPLTIRADILCENGRVCFCDPETTLYTPEHPEGISLGNGAPGFENAQQSSLDPGVGGHTFLIRNLAKAVLGEEKVFIPLEEGCHAVDTILSLYQSSKTGREIQIPQRSSL